MEALYNCTATGDVQVNSIVKQPANRYHTIDAEFAMESTEELTEVVCTAFNASNYMTPLLMHITGGFHGYATPKITIQTLDKLYGADEVPDTYEQKPLQISGVGKVEEIHEIDRYVLILTSAYDRGASSRRTHQIIAYRLPEARWKTSGWPNVGSTISFTGHLYSQQPTSGIFTITLDDCTWTTATVAPPTASASCTSKKRTRLSKGSNKGKIMSTDDAITPSISNSTTTTTAASAA
ncbi:hypothetical protein CF319_g1840 [Tilletia indica]|nr:hypothetical protein CF319_g1840 [Tilletia indica]